MAGTLRPGIAGAAEPPPCAGSTPLPGVVRPHAAANPIAATPLWSHVHSALRPNDMRPILRIQPEDRVTFSINWPTIFAPLLPAGHPFVTVVCMRIGIDLGGTKI